MEKQLKQFLRFLEKDKKASNNTLQSYKRDLEKFQTYLDEHNIKYLKVTEQDIKDYLNCQQLFFLKSFYLLCCIILHLLQLV